MAKGGKVPKDALRELREYAESLAPQKGFFSTLDQLIQAAPFERGSEAQWRGYLKPGRMLKREGMEFPLKKEELDYALKNFPKWETATKEQVLDFVRKTRPEFRLTDQSDPVMTTSKAIEKLVGPGTGEAVGSFVMSGSSGQVTTPPGTRLKVRSAQYGPDHDYGVRLSHQTPGSTYNESITRMKGYSYPQHFDPEAISWSRSSSHKLPEGAGVRLVEEIQSDPHQDAAESRQWQDGLTYERQLEYNQLQAELTQLAGTGHSRGANEVGYRTRLDAIQERIEQVKKEAEAAAGRRGHSLPGDEEEMASLRKGQMPNGAFLTPGGEARYDILNTRVPDAPFKNPADYARLELKKQLLNAVNNDEDYLALTRGRDQAIRYGYDPLHPKAVAFEHIYDEVNKGELTKLARQYGAEIVDLPMSVGTQADIRPDILQEFGVEDTNEFIDFVRQNESAGSLTALNTYLHQIDVGAVPDEMRERGSAIGGEIAKIMDEQDQADNAQHDRPSERMSADEWNRYMMRTNSRIRELFNEYKDIADTMYSLYSKKTYEDNPKLGLEGVESFPALKLTPEVKQRIKDAGVSLWAAPAAAAGLEMLDQEEEPEGMAKGGRAKKAEGGAVDKGPTGLDELRNLATWWNEFMLPGGVPDETKRALKDQYPEDYAQRIADLGSARTQSKQDTRRFLGTGASSLYATDEEGNVRLPFIHDPSVHSAPAPLPGIVDQTLELPDWFAQWFGTRGPQWSQEAGARSDKALDEIMARMDYDPADTPGEYALESAATMLTQPPVPGGTFKALKAPFAAAGKYAREAAGPVLGRIGQAASLVPRAGIEFFGPMIEASPLNYLQGTAFGTALRSAVDKIMSQGDHPEDSEHGDVRQTSDESFEMDPVIGPGLRKSQLLGAVKSGAVSLEEAEKLLDALEARTSIIESPKEETSMVRKAKGGKIVPFKPKLKADVQELQKILDSLDRPETELDPELLKRIGIEHISPYKPTKKAKGGRIVRADRIIGKLRERLGDIADDLSHGIRSGQMDEKGFIKNDEKAKRIYDLIYKLEDVQEEPTKHAKGGKVPPKGVSLMDLRKMVSGMLSNPNVEGTGKELAPLDTSANPVESIEQPPLEVQLQELEGKAKPSLAETPVSRRDVLKGMASLANPIQFDPMALLSGADAPVAAAVEDVAAPIMGVIARMNDKEGYERGAWGPTAAAAWRNLVNHMAEGLEPNPTKPGESSEFEDIQQLLDVLNEHGIDYSQGTDKDLSDQMSDPIDNVMSWVRGERNYLREAEYVHDQDEMPPARSSTKDLVEYHVENENMQHTIQEAADELGVPIEQVKEELRKRIKQESEQELVYDPEDLEASSQVRKIFDELAADDSILDDRREYQIDDLKQAYPELTWAEAAELRWLIEGSFRESYDAL
jgi:hypothetical protein